VYICLGHTANEYDWRSFPHTCLPLLALRDMSHFFPTKALLWKMILGTGASLFSLQPQGKTELRYSIPWSDWTKQRVKAVQAKDPA